MNTLSRRKLIQLLVTLPFLGCADKDQNPTSKVIKPSQVNKPKPNGESSFKLSFGSCCMQSQPQPIWKQVEQNKSDVFVFLGDNIYADTNDPIVIEQKYEEFKNNPDFKDFYKKNKIIGTWDDHDYGINDGGAEYPSKFESKKLFLNFFKESPNSVRYKRDGIYTSYIIDKDNLKVQIILLDLRWFRTPLNIDSNGHYIPHTDSNYSFLGEEQWVWLESEFKKNVDVRILCSSIQLVSSEHRWEKWANYPKEKQKLYQLIDKQNIKNLIVISGDMHFAELSEEKTPNGIVITELTASGLTHVEAAVGIENSKRLKIYEDECHFGSIKITKINQQSHIDMNITNIKNEQVMGHKKTLN